MKVNWAQSFTFTSITPIEGVMVWMWCWVFNHYACTRLGLIKYKISVTIPHGLVTLPIKTEGGRQACIYDGKGGYYLGERSKAVDGMD